jgi:hypothetical protein
MLSEEEDGRRPMVGRRARWRESILDLIPFVLMEGYGGSPGETDD